MTRLRILKDNGVCHASELNANICECLVNDLHVYRGDCDFVNAQGIWKAFHTGGNSSCHQHLHQHYPLYQQQCKEVNIPENHWAVPWSIWKARWEAENNPRKFRENRQGTLDGMFENVKQPQGFTCEGVLQAVGQFITCDDQVSRE